MEEIARLRDPIATTPEDATHGLPIRDKKAKMREAVIANVRVQTHQLRQNRVIAEAVKTGRLAVLRAYYEIGSGAVDLLETEEELRLTPQELERAAQGVRASAARHHAPAAGKAP